MQKSRIGLLASLMGAAAIAASAIGSLRPTHSRRRTRGDGFDLPSSQPARSRSKRYPQMVTAPEGEIRLWNDTVTTRQVLRARIKPWRSIQGRRGSEAGVM